MPPLDMKEGNPEPGMFVWLSQVSKAEIKSVKVPPGNYWFGRVL